MYNVYIIKENAYLHLKHLSVKEKQTNEIISNPIIVIPSWRDDIENLLKSTEQLVRYFSLLLLFLNFMSSELIFILIEVG